MDSLTRLKEKLSLYNDSSQVVTFGTLIQLIEEIEADIEAEEDQLREDTANIGSDLD